jgi:glycosyltransferase involved in cell wall biosynthesis
MRGRRIAIVYPRLGWGGSEARALWAITALKDDYEITLITAGPVNLPRLNEYYGTQLSARDFSVLQAPLPPGLNRTSKLAGLRGSFLGRFCTMVAPRFDLILSLYNVCDYGVPAIQFVADFSFDLTMHGSLTAGVQKSGWWDLKSPFRRAYLRVCDCVYAADPLAYRNNITIANSHWTARVLRDRYGIEARVLYPPVSGAAVTVSFDKRESGFVWIGRIVPDKRVDFAVRVLARVRQKGYAVHLHLVGPVESARYGRMVRRMCSGYDWVFFEGQLAGQRKLDLIAQHKYGINACQNEAFGIAVAEMVKCGCIVFVPAGGGQVEIVNCPPLIFQNEDHAVDLITAVLADEALQDQLRLSLSGASQGLSIESFTSGVRHIVQAALELGRDSAGLRR